MNAHTKIIDVTDTNMTSKGQVLIPKTLRDRAGLAPNAPVRVGMNDRGEVVVMPPLAHETGEQRSQRIRAALDAIAGTVDIGFATTDEYMDSIRPWRNDPL